LKKAFHYGYLDRHGKTPKAGKNPFLDEYEDLLDPAEDMRFTQLGVAHDNEGKTAESGKLGRCMALGLLTEHYGYTWFASISNLRDAPERGWSAHKKKERGNAPDWLIAKEANSATDDNFAVAEAKGTHNRIPVNGAKRTDWREQVQNIVI
jgi:hypothetical protein